MNAGTKPPSKNEAIKEKSIYLKGNVLEELNDTSKGDVSKESYELLKFHGSYQQFDRDKAESAKKNAAKKGERAENTKDWSFMLRLKIPGGRISAKQYLQFDEIADKYAKNTLRITTRETFQLHWIVKSDMRPSVKEINDALVTTYGGCGDVVRNVMTCPAPIKDKKHQRLYEDTLKVSDFTLPKSSAYHEIWLDGENLARAESNDDLEPLYGKFYLPRKFKIAIALPEDNSIDALTHDLAIFPIYEGDELKGYNLALGGGMGMTHNKPATYPRLANQIAFIPEDQLLRGVEAVIKLQRDHGDRSNRKHARLKYVVEEKGWEWTRKTLEEYYGEKLADPVELPPLKVIDHMGWHEQKDGKWYLGIPISSGRIIDREDEKIKSGLKAIMQEFAPSVILTADQNIILGDIEGDKKQQLEDRLKSFGIKLKEDLSPVYRNTIACVALPTCGLALAEAERMKIPFIADVDQILADAGLADKYIDIRISGCPNGCSRPYNSEFGIVGRMPGHYALFLGGDFDGERLNEKILDRVPYEHVKTIFKLLIDKYAGERQENENFGDFYNKFGTQNVVNFISESLGQEYAWAKAS